MAESFICVANTSFYTLYLLFVWWWTVGLLLYPGSCMLASLLCYFKCVSLWIFSILLQVFEYTGVEFGLHGSSSFIFWGKFYTVFIVAAPLIFPPTVYRVPFHHIIASAICRLFDNSLDRPEIILFRYYLNALHYCCHLVSVFFLL